MSISGKELAKIMNLSEASISIALNNKPGVSTKTRKLILKTAKEYGYDFSNHMIESEKPSTKGTIYFIIFKKHGTIVSDSAFFSSVIDGVNTGCHHSNYYVNICYLNDQANIEEQLNAYISQGCKGIILLATEMQKEDFVPFSKLKIPVILLDSHFSDILVDTVHINNIRGAYQATNYLYKATGSQPGYLHSSYRIQNFYERKSGFYKAIHANGLSQSRSIVHRLAPSIEGAYTDMLEVIKKKEVLAKCYFADNDLIAAGAIKALKESGYAIPKDISIIGFDDLPLCLYLEPNLSSVHVPKKYLGELAAKRLVEILSSKSYYPVKIEVETSIIERKSIGKNA